MTQILDAKYKKANLVKVVAESGHLTTDKQSKLLIVLRRYKKIFDGGLWKATPVKLELKPDAVPYHAPYPIPRSRKETTRKEIERLWDVG
jgi:hypothetical protein